MDIPLCQPLCPQQPQLILTNETAIPLYEHDPARFAGALAPTVEMCRIWHTKWGGRRKPVRHVQPNDARTGYAPSSYPQTSYAPSSYPQQAGCALTDRLVRGKLPIGLPLDCPPFPTAETAERPLTLAYIAQCKQAFRHSLKSDAAFYYLRNAPSFVALRAAVLALTDCSGRTIIAELAIDDDDGHLADGTDVCAAVGVLQCIGVTTVILTAHTPQALTTALSNLAPYARLSIGASLHSAWLRADPAMELYNTELLLPMEHDSEARLLAALRDYTRLKTVPREHDEDILVPDGTNVHFITPTVDISDEIECSHGLAQALLDAEDEGGALKLLLETEDDLVALEECQYLISRPVCLCAESAELLEKGLRIYAGLGLYDGTWEQPEEVLHYLEQKYGLIRL